MRGSKAEHTVNSRYSSFQVRERSLDSGRLWRTLWYSQTNSASPLGLQWPLALGLDSRWGKTSLIPTPRPLTRISPGKPVFQQASGSPDQASWDPHYVDINRRPISEPSAFNHSKEIWWGIISVPASDPQAGEVQITSKGSRGRCIWCTPPSCPFGTNGFVFSRVISLYLWPFFSNKITPLVMLSGMAPWATQRLNISIRIGTNMCDNLKYTL